MIAGGGRWLEVATLVGGWPESGRKTPKEGWAAAAGLDCGVERRRREEERESDLKLLGVK